QAEAKGGKDKEENGEEEEGEHEKKQNDQEDLNDTPSSLSEGAQANHDDGGDKSDAETVNSSRSSAARHDERETLVATNDEGEARERSVDGQADDLDERPVSVPDDNGVLAGPNNSVPRSDTSAAEPRECGDETSLEDGARKAPTDQPAGVEIRLSGIIVAEKHT
ncbi:unnamed protein product, partial [Scytosiphon promiscuus]